MSVVPVTIGGRTSEPGPSPEPSHLILNWGRGYRLSMFNLGLACCAVEAVAASTRHPDAAQPGVAPFARDPTVAEVMVVSGTITDKMAPAILSLYRELPEPRHVISFGSCANCGGPYWDSYCVTKGVDQLIPVDVYVPGCPPRPEALLDALVQLEARL